MSSSSTADPVFSAGGGYVSPYISSDLYPKVVDFLGRMLATVGKCLELNKNQEKFLNQTIPLAIAEQLYAKGNAEERAKQFIELRQKIHKHVSVSSEADFQTKTATVLKLQAEGIYQYFAADHSKKNRQQRKNIDCAILACSIPTTVSSDTSKEIKAIQSYWSEQDDISVAHRLLQKYFDFNLRVICDESLRMINSISRACQKEKQDPARIFDSEYKIYFERSNKVILKQLSKTENPGSLNADYVNLWLTLLSPILLTNIPFIMLNQKRILLQKKVEESAGTSWSAIEALKSSNPFQDTSEASEKLKKAYASAEIPIAPLQRFIENNYSSERYKLPLRFISLLAGRSLLKFHMGNMPAGVIALYKGMHLNHKDMDLQSYFIKALEKSHNKLAAMLGLHK